MHQNACVDLDLPGPAAATAQDTQLDKRKEWASKEYEPKEEEGDGKRKE